MLCVTGVYLRDMIFSVIHFECELSELLLLLFVFFVVFFNIQDEKTSSCQVYADVL